MGGSGCGWTLADPSRWLVPEEELDLRHRRGVTVYLLTGDDPDVLAGIGNRTND